MSEYQDMFKNIYQAQNALQELMEFSIEYNRNNKIKEVNLKIPKYPQDYFDFTGGIEVSNEEINKIVEKCINELEVTSELYFTYKGIGNTIIFVCKFCDCEDCDEYYYSVFVCKNYQEYDGIKDSKCKNCNKEMK